MSDRAEPEALTDVTIHPMMETDAGQVLDIYQTGLDGGNASSCAGCSG